MKRKFEELLAGEVCTSIINEPIDYEVEPLTAREIAVRRWGRARVIEGERSQT
jgi:hypothetical protein